MRKWVGLLKNSRIFNRFAEKVALAFTVQMQQITQVLLEVPDRVYGDVKGEVRRLGVIYRHVKHQLTAACEFSQ
jgi:hypothetical protein